jgi:ABC-type Na+ efflux pump permease subunit
MLICTPLTSRDVLRGKLRGLISFTLPLIAVPVATCLLFAVADLFRAGGSRVIFPESVLYITALMVAFAALACILGLQRSVRSQKTVNAVLTSVGILVLVCFGSAGCLASVMPQTHEFGAMLAPFTPFTALAVAIDPGGWLNIDAFDTRTGAQIQVRLLALVGSTAASVVYALTVVGLYKSMVRNFDMTIRKQSV